MGYKYSYDWPIGTMNLQEEGNSGTGRPPTKQRTLEPHLRTLETLHHLLKPSQKKQKKTRPCKGNCKRLRAPPRQPGRPRALKGGIREVPEGGPRKIPGRVPEVPGPPTASVLQLLQAMGGGSHGAGGGGSFTKFCWVRGKETEANIGIIMFFDFVGSEAKSSSNPEP